MSSFFQKLPRSRNLYDQQAKGEDGPEEPRSKKRKVAARADPHEEGTSLLVQRYAYLAEDEARSVGFKRSRYSSMRTEKTTSR